MARKSNTRNKKLNEYCRRKGDDKNVASLVDVNSVIAGEMRQTERNR